MTAKAKTRAEPELLESFELEGFAPYLMTRIMNRLSKSLAQALKPLGLTPQNWRILVVLQAKEPCSLTELGVYAVIDQSTLSRTVDRMTAADLLQRDASVDDSRTVMISRTGRGCELFEKVLPIAVAQYDWAVRGIDAEERERFTETLHKILANIRMSPYP